MSIEKHIKETNVIFADLESKMLSIDLEPHHKKQVFEFLKQLSDIQIKYSNLLNDPYFKINDKDDMKSDFNINTKGNFINQTFNKNKQ